MPAVIDSATTVEVVDATLSDDVGSAIAQPNFEFTKVDIRTDIPTSTSSKTALCTQENVGIIGDSVFANSQEIIQECLAVSLVENFCGPDVTRSIDDWAEPINVVLLDSQLADSDALQSAIRSNVKTFVYDSRIDSAGDVLSRVNQWLDASDLTVQSLSILSHGAAGGFQLGSTWITDYSLCENETGWQELSRYFQDDAQIYIFGCDVVSDGLGQSLLDGLAMLTQADVFASIDVTGLGGNWQLEAHSENAPQQFATAQANLFDGAKLEAAEVTLAWYNSSWNYRQSVNINNTMVSGGANLTDFTVLVSVSSNSLRSTANGGNVGQSDGGDFVFTSADGTTKLNHQIESYDATTGTLVAWVRVPTLKSATSTQLYVYYGNAAAADQWNNSGTWNTGTRAVYHLASDYNDSTSNANAGTNSGSTNLASAKISAGDTFNGTSQFISVNDSASLDITGNLTISAWIRKTSNSGYDTIAAKSVGGNDYNYYFSTSGDELEFGFTTTPGSYQFVASSAVNLATNTWYHVVATYDDAANSMRLYLDGAQVASGSTTGSLVTNAGALQLGRSTTAGEFFDGSLDEVKIEAVTQSAGWIQTQYRNQSTPGTYITVSAEESRAVNSIPAAQSTSEDVSRVFSSGNGNQISVSDPNAGSNPIEVTLTVTNGTMTLSGTTGLTFVVGDGSGDGTMTVRGTVANINNALNGLTYTPTSNYNGSATLTIATRDSTLVSLDLDANIQAEYTFDGNANDVAPGTAQNGTLTNGAAIVNDATRGQVLNLDGVDDFVQISGTYSNPTEVTIGGWVNLAAGSGRKEFISLSDRVHIALDEATSGVKGSVQTGAGAWTDLVTGQFIAGTGWHHVMYTYSDSGNVHKIFIDGVEVASSTINSSIYWTGATNAFIGRHPSGVNYANAKIDDVRIYNRALTTVEVASLANDLDISDTDSLGITVTAVNDVPTVSQVTGAIAAYDFENGSGSATSTVTSGLPMTIGSGVSYSSSAGRHTGSTGLLFANDADSTTPPVSLAGIPNVAASNAFSFSGWVRFDTLASTWGYERIFDFGGGSQNSNIVLARQGTTNNLYIESWNASGGLTGISTVSNIITAGSWMHVAVTADSSNVVTLYVNGASVTSFTATSAINYAAWTKNYIGASNWSADRQFRGAMDDISIFDRALSAADILKLASTATAPTIVNKSIAENAPNGTNVFKARSSDVDAGDGVTYSIFSGNTNSTFAINSTTGQVTVADATMLNYEVNTSYLLVIRATDTAGLTSDQTVTVNVTDVNEAPNDITLGSAPTGLTTGGNASLVSGSTYQLTPNTTAQAGAVWGAVNLSQDLTITSRMFFGASDGGADGMAFAFQNVGATSVGAGATGFGASLTGAFGISFDTYFNGQNNEINSDFSQFFRQGATATQGTTFDTANAHDNIEDGLWHDVVISWNASTKTLSYSLDGIAIDSKTYDVVATDWAGNPNGYFGFGAGTGGAANQQQVEIISVQTGGSTSIAENSAAGTVVGTAAAIDPDRTGTVTYSLLNNAGGRFAINSSTGQITVATGGSSLDFEAGSSHRIVTRATDSGGLTFDTTMTINLSNVNEAPVDIRTSSSTISIANAGFEANVLVDGANTTTPTGWTVSGGGVANPTTFNLSTGNPTEGSNYGFADQGGTLSQTLGTNFDSTLNYQLSVDVGSQLGMSVSAGPFAVRLFAGATQIGVYTANAPTQDFWNTIRLDVNGSSFAAASGALRIELANTGGAGTQVLFDNVQLTTSAATAAVAENSVNGTVVTTVTGVDRDAGNSLTYSLTDSAGGRFAIHNTTGQITVTNGSLLDFEASQTHTVVVRTTDQGNLTYDRTLTISLTNVNEAPTDMGFGSQFVGDASTVVSGMATMPSLNDFTLEIKATPRQAITLVAESNSGILPGNNGGMAIMPDQGDAAYGTTGATTRSIGLAIGTNGVVVYQHSSSIFSSLLTYAGTIAPDSDIAVVFINKTPSLYINGVLVDTGIQSIATSLRPTVGAAATVGVGGGSHVGGRYFDGTLSDYRIWNSALDATTINNNRTAAIATGTNGLLANMIVTSINENAANGTVVGRARGYDPDAGATLGYSLTNNAGGRFTINNTTGEITVANSSLLDFETNTNHTITVRTTDQSGLTYDENVTIRLRNVNETPTALTLTGATTGAGSSAVYNATTDSYYAFVSTAMTWEAAMDNAQSSLLGGVTGTLVNINSAAEQTYVAGLSANHLWIGASDKNQEGVWRWYDGDTAGAQFWSGSGGGVAVGSTYNFWQASEPNNSLGAENYAHIYATAMIAGRTWNDILASTTWNSIVEWTGTAFRAAQGVAGSVTENATAGTVVGTLAAIDADSGETLTYSIVGTNSNFEVVGNELRVRTGASLDLETAPQHTLTVRVTDSANNTRDQLVTINVVNVNEAPTVLNAARDVTVANPSFESQTLSAGSFNYSVTGWTSSGNQVTLGQAGVQGAAAANYVGNTVSGANFGFASGISTLSQTLSETFDSAKDYQLTVAVGDRDEATPGLSQYRIRLYAGATLIGETIGTPVSTGLNDVQLYVDGAAFSAAQNGALRIELGTTSPDHSGQQLGFDNVRLRVLETNTLSLAENSTNGSVVGQMAAIDPDAFSTVSYSLTDNAGGRFAINNSTGQITVANGSLLDFESGSSHTLVVRTTDQGGLTFDQNVTINLTNVNEAPLITGLDGDVRAYVEGDAPVLIGSASGITDVDSPDFNTGTLTVSFTAGNDSTEDVFGIRNEGSGAGQIGVSGSNVTFGGLTIGTFTGGSGGTNLVITLNSNANATSTTAIINNLTYFNTDSDNPNTTTRNIRIVLTDGDGATSVNNATTMTVATANDAPVLDSSRSPVILSVSEHAGPPAGAIGTLVSSLIDFAVPAGQLDNVTDVDPGATTGIAITETNANVGTWWYSTNNGSTWQRIGYVSNTFARLLAADANTRIYFEPTQSTEFSGTISNAITFRAWDQSSGVNGGIASTGVNGGTSAFSVDIDTAAISIDNVNDAPRMLGDELVTNGTFTTNLSGWTTTGTVTHGGGADRAILGAGNSVGPHTLSQTITTVAGQTYQLSFDYWDGQFFSQSLVASVTGIGNLLTTDHIVTDVSASVATRYTFTFVADSSSATITLTDTSDQSGLANGTNGIDGLVDNVSVRQLAGQMGTLSYTENDGARAIHPTLNLLDFDSTNLFGATVQFQSGFNASQDLLSFTNQLGITGSYNPTTGVLTLTGSASVADYQTALRSITYTNGSETPTGSRTISFTVDDGAATSTLATRSVAITDVNDAPVAVVDTATAVEAGGVSNGTAGTNPTGNVLTNDTDVDAGDTKTVTGVLAGVQASASSNVGSAVTGSFGSITIAADGSYTYNVDNSNAAVQALRTSGNTLQDVFTYTMRDTAGLASTTQITVTIEGANDAPNDLALANPSGTNLITNGSFETNNGAANTSTGGASASGWTAIGGEGVEVWNSFYADGPAGASHGISRLELNVGNNINGIAQNVTTASGQTYVLSFDLASRTSMPNSQVQVYWRGELVGTITQTAVAWRTHSFVVTGSGGSDELRFVETSTNNTSGSSQLDNVRLIAENSPAISVAENAANGTVVALAGARDADTFSIDTRSYSLTDSANGRFAIDSTTGIITVVDGTQLNFEATTSHTITIRVADALGVTYDENFTIAVTNVNEDPIAVVDTATAVEAGGASNGTAGTNPTGNVLTNDTDVDAGDTKTVTGVSSGTQVSASGNVASNITGTYGTISIAVDGTYTYTVNNSNATVQALRTSGQTLTDVFTYTMTDAGGLTSTTQITVTIQGANDAPTQTAIEGTALSYTENVGAIAITSTLSLADVDDANLNSATIQITGNYAAGQDQLSFTDQNGITGSWNSTNGTLTLSGSASTANYQAALRSVTYTNTSEAPNIATRTVSFTVSDGALSSNVATRDIAITAVNDAPVLDNTGTMTLTTITEDQTANNGQTVASIISSAGGDRITDVDSGAVEGIAITATTNGNGWWEYSINGGSSWDTVGTVSGASSLLLRDIDLMRFVPNGQNATTGDITFRAWDQSTGTSGTKVDTSTNGTTTAFSTATEVASITISDVNDAPVNSLPSNVFTALNTARTFSTASGNAFQISDVDAGGSTVQFTLSATSGTLSLSSTTGLTLISGANSSGTFTYSGTLSAINTALGNGVTFTPTSGFRGLAQLTLQSSDLGNTGSGGTLTDSDMVNVHVGAIVVTTTNDASNGTVTSISNLVASDGGDGVSLREAIHAANNTAGTDYIYSRSPAPARTRSMWARRCRRSAAR